MNDLFRGNGIKVDILNKKNFNIIINNLSRIGIANYSKKELYPTAVILHKKDKEGISHYSILHFKEMFLMDGKETNITDDDYDRRDNIIKLLETWGLLKVLNREDLVDDEINMSGISVISKKEDDFKIIHKYAIGKIKKKIGEKNESK